MIHVPLDHYSFFLQPILRLLFDDDHQEPVEEVAWTSRHEFLNLSITPVECSVICNRDLANRFFVPLIEKFNRLVASDHSTSKKMVHVSQEDYTVIQVDGEGLDAGQRVLELTSPLAMAGMSVLIRSPGNFELRPPPEAYFSSQLTSPITSSYLHWPAGQ